ncbi:hypothetical protein ACHQM5_000952 [Ranunculus cassubicifolius]
MASQKVVEEPQCTINPHELFKIYPNPDGSVTRNEFPLAPAIGEDSSILGQPHVSKDVTLNAGNKTWMRIFRPTKLPSNDKKIAKLPIILYFHPGAFILYHPDTMIFNESCGRYASEIPSIVVSVEYRLAPENRLPAAYDDAKDALCWIKQQALDSNGDPWLRDYGDFSRCYIMGCSNGANIAYRTGLVLPELDLGPVKVAGLILNQPLFGGEEKTRLERKMVNDDVLPSSAMDMLWGWALPVGTNRDHEFCNPTVEGTYSKNIKKMPRILVRGFEGDVMLDRQMQFVKMLMKNGVQITAHFGEFGFHTADCFDAKRHLTLIRYLKDFI